MGVGRRGLQPRLKASGFGVYKAFALRAGQLVGLGLGGLEYMGFGSLREERSRKACTVALLLEFKRATWQLDHEVWNRHPSQ